MLPGVSRTVLLLLNDSSIHNRPTVVVNSNLLLTKRSGSVYLGTVSIAIDLLGYKCR